MEGSKMHSAELQLSVIQNEKERLVACLDSTIQRARSLCSQPSAASRVMRENACLLARLTDWADSAEADLAQFYRSEAHLANGTGRHNPAGAQPEPMPAPCRPAVSAETRGPARSAVTDVNTTAESAVSFHTAAGAGTAASTSPQPLYHPDTAARKRRTSDQSGGRAGTPLLETPPPPPAGASLLEPSHPPTAMTSLSKKSSAEVSSIISRHLRKKKNTPEPPKEVTQKPPPSGVEVPVIFSCHDDTTGYTYLNLRQDQDSLARLTEELTELALHPGRVSRLPKQGELVMAVWQGAWYRARVTQVLDKGDVNSMVALQYIDYGNSDQQAVSQIRFLPDKMKEAPAAAYKCKLVNLRVGGAQHWPLQRRLLLLLTDGPECRLTAVFRPSPLPGLYEVSLASDVAVDGRAIQADVVETVNGVLLMEAAAAARQAESGMLELRPLLVPFRRPVVAADPPPVRASPEQAVEEKVRSWLAGQDRGGGGDGPPAGRTGAAGRSATARSARANLDLDISFASAESRPSRSRRCRPPPEYAGLQLVWTARPIEQPPTGDGPHHVLMLKIHDPDCFYLAVRCQLFDEFEERLTAVYSRLPLHPEQAVRHMLLPGSYWVARWQQRDTAAMWCRCVVMEEPTAEDKDAPPPADYPVLWVDYGDTDRLPAASFRPMTEEFAAEPLFAVRARCAGVYPVDELGAPVPRYSPEAADVFRNLLRDRHCLAAPVPSESTPSCLAVLLEAMIDSTPLVVIDALQELGIAALRFPELDPSFDELENGEPAGQSSPPPARELNKWDPMTEDFVSPYNRPEEGQDAEVAGMTGRGDPAEPPICTVFSRGGNCWDGIACPKRHVIGGEQLPEMVLVHTANTESLVPPRLGSTVYVKVSAVVSPGKFYVQLPFGALPAQEVNNDHAEYRRRLELEETLESLSAAMGAAYRGTRRQDYSAMCRPSLGEVLVAPWQGGWHRGLVTDLTERLQPHQLTVEVFLVDHGVTLSCDAEELREIKKEFNLLPYQAVECSLALVEPAGGSSWSAEAISRFVQLVERPCLLATVVNRSPEGHLEIELYEGSRRLAQRLADERLAVLREKGPPLG